MSVTVRKGDPRSPEAETLLRASQDYLAALYPPEHNHYLSVDALCTPDISFFIADLGGMGDMGGKPIGCAALKRFASYAEIKSMFVDPNTRSAGTGGILMTALEAEAKSNGLASLKLETGDTLYPAHRLYARHGFTLCGPFGDYAEGPHSVFMEKHL